MSNSKVVKSYRITLDDKNYRLSPEIFYVESKQHDHQVDEESEIQEGDKIKSPDELKASLEEEMLIMRTEMIEQSQVDAKAMIDSSKEDSQKMISDAYSEAQEILENAKKEGFTSGEKDGFEQGRAIADGLINDAMDIKESIQQKNEAMVKENEEMIVNMIVAISEKILNKKISEDYELIEGLVKSALDKCVYTEGLILRVSSHDYDYAISSKKKFLALAEGVSDIEIREDSSLEGGSCIIDSESGSIDSSVWTQFEHVRDKFIELLRSE